MRKPTYEDLELRIKQLEENESESQQQTQNALKKIEWLLKPKGKALKINNPDYGDLTNLNTNGLILKNIDKDVLKDIVQDYLVLLDTSAAIYEKNGDYALGVFSSNWCNMLDNASRKLCGNCSDAQALASGVWLCHESCWTKVSKKAIETGKTVDEECNGGLRIYAVPIWLNKEVIGAINFGYGNPPTDKAKLEEISEKYKIPYAEVLETAIKYETRPEFIIDIAKERLYKSARIISEIVGLQLAETKIQFQNEEIASQNEELEAQNEEMNATNFELQKSEERFRALFEQMPSGVAVYEAVDNGLDFIFKGFNNAAEKIDNIKRSQIIGKRLTEVFPGSKEFGFPNALKNVWKTGKVEYKPEAPYRDDTGKIHWRENWIYKLPTGDVVAIYTDVTVRKLAQLKLEESENKMQRLFDNMNSGFAYHKIVLDENGKPVDYIFLEVNTVFEQMTGLKSANIIGKRVSEAIPGTENDPANWIGVYGKVALSGNPIKFQNYSADIGKWFSVSAYSPGRGYFATIIDDVTSQIKAKQELASKEELYRSLLESVAAGIGYYNLDGKLLVFNTQAAKNLNGLPEDFEGKTMFELYGEEAGKFYLNRILLAAKSKDILEFEDVVDLPTQKKWFNSKYNKIHDGKGNVIGIQIISTDISEIKNQQLELKHSEAKYRSYIDNAPHGIFVIDANGQYLEANPTAVKMTGYGIKEILQMNIADFSPNSEGRQKAKERLLLLLQDGKMNVTIPFVRKDKSVGWWQVDAVKISDNKFLGYQTDVTKKIEAEESLVKALQRAEESETRFKTLHNASFGGITIHDKGIILDCNLGLSTITGFSHDELIGMDGITLLCPEYRDQIMSNILTEYEKAYDVEGIRKNGERYHVRLEARMIPHKGQIVRVVEFRDISEQKKVEIELLKAKERAEESDRLKSAFLANMSHEIRTPMNGILGFADLLKEPDLSGEQQQKYISVIERSGERMLNIINDLIDISKIEAGQMEVSLAEIDVKEQSEYLCTFFKPEMEKKGIHFIQNIPALPKPLLFTTDREKLYAIITNLLKNAIKYTRQGSIEFGVSTSSTSNSTSSTSNSTSSTSNLKADSEPNELQFYVKDTGIGIPANRIDAIFERFIQADIEDKQAMEGAGLGLAISKAYAEMLGGKLWVESLLGQGSTFYFTLPDQPRSKINTDQEKTGLENLDESNKKHLKILVAEDDETSKLHLSILLQNMAEEIYYARSGTEAIKMGQKHPELDLILMDIKMPLMDGDEASREIRKFNSDIIIIAQTAYALSGDRAKALAAGCNDYITKPIKKELLIEIIQKHFD